MPEPPLDHLTESVGTAEQHRVVDDVDAGDDDQDDQPEPEEHVQLLVDDVDGKHAKRVVGLNSPTGSVLLVETLCHPREDPGHRINPVLRVVFNVIDHLQSVGAELPAEEQVNEVDVGHDVDEGEEVAEDHLGSPEVVGVDTLHHVLGQPGVSPASLLVVELRLPLVETRDDARHLPALHQLQQDVGQVEETGLEEEDKGDPLVVGLVLHLVPLSVVLPHSGVDHISTCRRNLTDPLRMSC